MNIIVTGGSSGIGKETVLHLSGDKNNQLLITGRNQKSLAKICDSAENKNIRSLISDFRTLHNDPEKFKNEVSSVFKSVDILINNAGSLYVKDFKDASDSQAREMMEINFFAPVLIIRSLLPLMRPGAHIVNISSMGGFQGSVKFRGLSLYSASKAAISCLSECLAGEFKDLRISVNCLAPGSVQTEMLEKAFPGYKAPLTAAEMGKFVSDFALNGNRFHNGKVIPVSVSTP